ncbi:outer membrane protein transport protein [Roseovarius sp. BRH_c41]|jgi:long-chain fatty acid transport protein|uniref:OmpP1/FadL family transporter n=1 Tax=Roseovarius sp. BRH_c41 TaxID=1629709 RepID=UPI0005F27398|nr:outer membrane protein transport protein [Roseovarius sp. BRH_c41]KJS45275.1 MAG: membrane protein [Roseovarius sp. BRH_c41]
MKTTWLAATLLTATASTAFGGEIERRGDPSMILFEKGKNYLEFSAATIDPSVSGTALPGIPTAPTGNIQERYQSFAGGYKHDLNDRLTFAIVVDEPVGASVNYRTPPAGLGGAFFGGSNAEVNSVAFTGLAKYKATDRISVYGGLRYIGLSGNITVISPATLGSAVPAPNSPYTLGVSKDFQVGYLLGAAYEIPDIALRVALTYESKTEHDFKDNTGAGFKVEIPQAFTLHAQSGIAANTLLFGSVKWREWSKFAVQPGDFFSVATGVPVNVPIASGPSDIWTYELGIGRKFNENWSGAFILGYEKDEGDIVGNLSGKDGYISYGLAATYETEAWEISAGIKYFDIGDANTSVTSFSGSDAIAIGTKVAFRF